MIANASVHDDISERRELFLRIFNGNGTKGRILKKARAYFGGNYHDGVQVTQDVLEKLWRYEMGNFTPSQNVTPWLDAVTKNTSSTHYRLTRKIGRARLVLLTDIGSGDFDLFDNLPDERIEDPSQQSASAEDIRSLRQEIAHLPSHYRKVIVRSYFKGQSQDEIARCEGISISVVKYRARAAYLELGKALLRRGITSDAPNGKERVHRTTHKL